MVGALVPRVVVSEHPRTRVAVEEDEVVGDDDLLEVVVVEDQDTVLHVDRVGLGDEDGDHEGNGREKGQVEPVAHHSTKMRFEIQSDKAALTAQPKRKTRLWFEKNNPRPDS